MISCWAGARARAPGGSDATRTRARRPGHPWRGTDQLARDEMANAVISYAEDLDSLLDGAEALYCVGIHSPRSF
jgi:hypothetical protein